MKGTGMMLRLLQQARIGLAVAAAMAMVMASTTGTLLADETAQERGDRPSQPPAAQPPAAQQPAVPPAGVTCYERYIPEPVNEKGIQCPGEPAIWKSYTYASDGFGYYTETDNFGSTPFVVRLGYVHQDGRVAIMIMHCNPDCEVDAWNGVDFPFGH
jgi:hypothetical protein